MNKRIISILMILFTVFIVTGCGNQKQEQIEFSQIQKISKLATLQARYENVAKIFQEKHSGVAGWGEKDRYIWIQYTGVVNIGVDVNDIDMSINKNVVKVKVPDATILYLNYEDYNQDSIISNDDSWFNKNVVSYKTINDAIKQADTEMLEKINSNKSLFTKAKSNVKEIIKNYIEEIGKINGIEYTIEFVE